VAFSPDGTKALTDGGKIAILWDVATGREIRRLRGHTERVSSVVFSPDGTRALTVGYDGFAILWDVATGQEIRRLRGAVEGRFPSVAVSPDGTKALINGKKGAVFWDIATGQKILQLQGDYVEAGLGVPLDQGHAESRRPGQGDVCLCVALSPDGTKALTGGSQGAILWDVATRREIRRLMKSGSVLSVAFSPDGTKALMGCLEYAFICDLATGRAVQRLRQDHFVESVAFSPDGTKVLTGDGNGVAILWDSKTGQIIRRLKEQRSIKSVAFSPDGTKALTAGSGKYAILWDVSTGREIRRLRGRVDLINSLCFSPDGTQVLTGSWDNTASVWDLRTGRVSHRLEGHIDNIIAVAFSPDGARALTAGADKLAILWDVSTGREIRRLKGEGLGYLESVAFSPSGNEALTGGSDKLVIHWDLTTGQEIRRLQGHTSSVTSVAFSPDGTRALSASNEVILWDLKASREIRRLREPTFELLLGSTAVGPAAFSHCGTKVLTGGKRSAFLWEAATGRGVRPIGLPLSLARSKEELGHEDVISSVAFSRDDTRALTGSFDGTAIVWDLATGKRVLRLVHGKQEVLSVAYSPDPDGRHALTGGFDGVINLWDLTSGVRLCSLIGFIDGSWAIVDPNGRFDTNNLESILGLEWVFPDDPLRPLPPEIFMRDYYEPRLLPRVLAEEEFRAVRPLAELNRVQPRVETREVKPAGAPDQLSVVVEVSAAEGKFLRGGHEIPMRTGTYDLRLFRNGQLVGRWPESADEPAADPEPTSKPQMDEWRSVNRVVLDTKTGRATRTFTVRLPHREKAGPVEFTAYAFNEDRVKSPTATLRYDAPANPLSGKPRAYLIAMGVSATKSPTWDLAFAAADARLMAGALGEALTKAGRYEVVPVLLTSERADDGTVATATATKANLHAVLDLLAGRPVDDRVRGLLPGGDQLRAATPDDLVLLTFSGHGYTARGALYLLPYDVGERRERVEDILDKCISTSELSAWLRHVDAGELALVVDACHSAAAVRQPGFKWGPLGSPGLGQLAYDKGMRVLAGSQADDVAVESARIRQGLLTYALASDGLEQRRAARDGIVTLKGLLTYAASRVPELYREVMTGEVREASGAAARNVGAVRPRAGQAAAVQQPELFDSDGNKTEVVLSGAKAAKD